MKAYPIALLALVALWGSSPAASAAPPGRTASQQHVSPQRVSPQHVAKQPVAQHRVTQHGVQRGAPPVVEHIEGPVVEHSGSYDPAPAPGEYFDEGCSSCQPHNDCCCDFGRLTAGFAFVLVKPHREDDLAFTRTVQDGTFLGTSDQAFDADMDLGPRAWLEYNRPNGMGARATYWGFDHASEVRSDSPSADRVEILQTPVFRGFSLTTQTPDEVLSAVSEIEVDVLDLEGVKWTEFCCWKFGATAGIRHASISQGYSALLENTAGAPRAFIIAGHRFDGLGPTFSIEGRRPFGCLSFYSMARGSLLYGNGKLSFTGVEDADTDAPLTTTVQFHRNDMLTVAEIQVGVEWRREFCNGNLFFCRTALEGQAWQGIGSALDEDGDLGFFGLNVALGLAL